MKQDTQKNRDWLDGAAVALSGLCLLHCLALPLVVAGVPFLAQYAETHLHYQVLVAVIPLSVIALALGYRRHRDWRIVMAGAVGMTLLVIGATVAHTQLGITADRIFTVIGSLVLATAHYFNSYRKKLANSSC
jgi:hypothetical protein